MQILLLVQREPYGMRLRQMREPGIRKPKDPEIPPIKNGSSTGNPPYNSDYQTLEQATPSFHGDCRSCSESWTAVGSGCSSSGTGNQFNMDASTSMDPYTVRQQDKVSHIRVQRPELYETWFGDGAGNVTTTVDGKQISIRPYRWEYTDKKARRIARS